MKLEDFRKMDDLTRIIQEIVPGKQITMAHVISSPNEIIYKKLGLDPKVDYSKSAIGVLTISPAETAIIASDIALKKSGIEIGFIDRFSGTLIVTGKVAEVTMALESIIDYTEKTMGFTVCNVTTT